MSHSVQNNEERLDLIFQALANRTRRALLARLKRGPAMVTELAKPFGMSLNAVSKHLNVLERASLINRSIEGRVHTCTLIPATITTAEKWLGANRPARPNEVNALQKDLESVSED